MADVPTAAGSLTRLFAGAFPLGSHLCREPMPAMSELKRDTENLKRHGLNLIKLQEHWAIDEPLEGHYDFSRYEELIAHAESLDLAVYLGLTCEQAPAWLWRKHPDCRMVGLDGRPIACEAKATLPADGRPGPCFDHAGARADQGASSPSSSRRSAAIRG
jgi:beta-galactosidase